MIWNSIPDVIKVSFETPFRITKFQLQPCRAGNLVKSGIHRKHGFLSVGFSRCDFAVTFYFVCLSWICFLSIRHNKLCNCKAIYRQITEINIICCHKQVTLTQPSVKQMRLSLPKHNLIYCIHEVDASTFVLINRGFWACLARYCQPADRSLISFWKV